MKQSLTIILFAAMTLNLQAQENIEYQKPSAEILQLAEFERAPSVIMNDKRDWMIYLYRPTYKTLDDLNQDEIKLAGLRVNPKTNISSTITYYTNLKIRKLKDKNENTIKGLPQNPKIANLRFSPDDKKLAFTNTTENGIELWVLDLETATAKKISSDNLNANLGTPFDWLKDSSGFLIKKLPKNRPNLIDSKDTLPKGPIVSVSDGNVSQNRTYQDLLKNPTDEKNFETLVSSEIVKITLDGKETPFVASALYSEVSISPDGNYVMISTIQRPFSYIVPLSRFPMVTEVYDINAKLIKKVNEVPLNEVQPKGFSATRKGKRSMNWRADQPASLYYVEALDGGDPNTKADYRDEVFVWNFPFDKPASSLMKTKQRYAGIIFGDEEHLVVYDSWYDTRSQKTYLVNPQKNSATEIADRNFQDRYNDPGDFHTKKNKYGREVIDIKNGKTYLKGDGYTKDGQFPFIDEFDFSSLKKNRIYTSKLTNEMENIIDIIDPDSGTVLVSVQSKTNFPNYYLRNIKTQKAEAITQFKNPFESIKDVHKEVISYKRKDGVELQGTLYLPANYDFKNKKKLPLLVWAYPREYKDKATAGQNIQNPNEFTFPYYGSFVYWVTKGYAVLDDASFPIIGEDKKEPNDTFIQQLVDNGRAAIDAVDQLGYIDLNKVAVGGHSYGAFMTANLLTHSNDYACGIARSGAYNRTLTPFGFQSEQRNYWDNPDLYNTMSPFMQANEMKKPLLLIHGEADNNPGTFTLQTERYFQALKNLGAKDVRMVILPKESHGYVAKENILHLLWEQDQFLEKCLKK